MRAPISVVIPTLNAASGLHDCLLSLMEGVDAGLIRELIVSDGGSTDQTPDIATEWGAEVVSGVASRGGQLRRGCAVARGEWILVLHADTCLSPNWVAPVSVHLQKNSAGWCHLAFEGGGLPGRIVAAWANWRSRRGLPYGDQGLLIRRALYDAVGGYPDQPLMEDVVLVRRLSGRLSPLDVTATTSARRYQQQGWIRRGSRNLWILFRYWLGADPESLAKAYRK